MKLLLDTHTFLWFVLGDAQLSGTARALITDPANEKLVSPASYWEIAIKISIGKYTLHEPFEDFLDRGIVQNGFVILGIDPKHVVALAALPFHHRDPFDRLLVAQAVVEQAALVSVDATLDAYPISRLW